MSIQRFLFIIAAGGLILFGLLACQKSTNFTANNNVPDQGGTSSGGPAAIVDLVHCHSHRHLIVDITLGQGRLLLLGLEQQALAPPPPATADVDLFTPTAVTGHSTAFQYTGGYFPARGGRATGPTTYQRPPAAK